MARRISLLSTAFLAIVALLAGASCTNRESRQARAPQETATASATVAADGVQEITVVGNQQFRFVPSTVRAKPGPLRIILTTPSGTPHDLLVEGISDAGASTGLVAAGEKRRITVDLQPGRYRFVCTLHTRLHMVGTIVVS